jgi:acyloxyacyl hydrolase
MLKSLARLSLLVSSLMSTASADLDNCLYCTVVVTLVEEIALTQGLSGTAAFDLVCAALAKGSTLPVLTGCDYFGKKAGPIIDNALVHNLSPDIVCQQLGDCDGSCKLFASWPPAFETMVNAENSPVVNLKDKIHAIVKDGVDLLDGSVLGLLFPSTSETSANTSVGVGGWVGNLIQFLEKILGEFTAAEIDRVFNQHLPLKDSDLDGFGAAPTLRGYDWRGRDCDDSNKNIYPGTIPADSDKQVDSNCNGIFGMDNKTGVAFEDEFCSGAYSPRGLIIVGDSATAHFSVPPAWLTAKSFTVETMDGLLGIATDELDWPACSWSTAHKDPSVTIT